ncbi:MAG: leishmanolysin-related zinc metalloendopeptidase [Cyanobacteria bacterium P01_B01_bin.77]
MRAVINAYSYTTTLTSFERFIDTRWEQGYDIANVEFGDGVWFGVFSENVGAGAYSLNSDIDEFTEDIAERWQQGYNLIDVGYGNDVWFGVFNDQKSDNINGYSYQFGLTNFETAILDRWDQGFVLTDVEYGDGVWFGTFDQGSGRSAYSYNPSLNRFTDEISTRWDQGYELIDVEFGNGTWFGVFGEYEPGTSAYSYNSSLADFEQTIAQRWDDGYELIDTAYGNGTWFGVFYQAGDDSYEQNDFFSSAYDLSADEQVWLSDLSGLGVQSDDDWYKISVTPGYENVIVDLQFTDSEGDIDLALYDAMGQFITSSISTSDNEYIDIVVPESGDYYLQVYYDDAGNAYDLWWDDLLVETVTPPSNFQIDVNFVGSGLTATQQAIFDEAADRWEQIIVGDLPDTFVAGVGVIDDVVIDARGIAIDRVGEVLGRAAPTSFRPGSLLPQTGLMEFDTFDLNNLEANGELLDVILHEMGHVLGIGTLWDDLNLLDTSVADDPRFSGQLATAEYNRLFGVNETSVPVEADGGPGTALSHWRESVMGNEAMTGFNDKGVNPLSRITVASLGDLGYDVDISAADFYRPSDISDRSGLVRNSLNFLTLSSNAVCSCPSCCIGAVSLHSAEGDASNGIQPLNSLALDDVSQFMARVTNTSQDELRNGDLNAANLLVDEVGHNLLSGEAGNDVLLGKSGDDLLHGGSGHDLLFGGLGNDTLTGDDLDRSSDNKGNDLFVLAQGYGADTVTDFEVTMDLIGLVGELTFADLSIEQVGDDTAISLGNERLATLVGVNSTHLQSSHFINNFVASV